MADEKDTTPGKAETPQDRAGKIFELCLGEMAKLGYTVQARPVRVTPDVMGLMTIQPHIELVKIRSEAKPPLEE